MTSIDIRRVTVDDVFALQAISRQTFHETFSSQNTDEDMKKYLTEALSYEKLAAELSSSGSEFYFAELDAQVVGYLKLNFGLSQTEAQDDDAVEIERIYVLKAFLGVGVGSVLFGKAIQVARQRNAHYVWLGVWEHNHRAIRFYKRNGFVEFGMHTFRLGSDQQTDIMMRLILD